LDVAIANRANLRDFETGVKEFNFGRFL